jgi:hypothetical protein
LADIGMTLARAVAAKALTEWSEPEEPPQAAEPRSNQPPQPAPESNPGLAARAALLGTEGSYLRAPTCKSPTCKSVDPALLFTRLAATVRACIALEARLAAGTPATARATSLLLRADPRRAPLRDVFRQITQDHPDRATLLREITTRLDEELAADAAQIIDQATILFAICEELAIEIDFAALPDEYLDLIAEPPATPPPDD